MIIKESVDSPGADIDIGRRVLARDIVGLTVLSAELDDDFRRTVQTFADLSGKVVLSGMGKSGHIAQKIAATLASTGTPAHYIHPGEASHGDLGMLSRGDALMVLSNSGETSELRDIVAYAKYLSVPLISVIGKRQSLLARAADIALVLPQVEEGCPLGLAPTTSTLMMLALGDAIAVALMERRGFSIADFYMRHPGGRLGGRFLTVSDVMHDAQAVPLVRTDAVMSEALLVMTGCRFGCVGIVDSDGRLTGIITDGDLRRQMAPGLLEKRADDLMTPKPRTIRREVLASEALALMNERQITCLFVTRSQVPEGIIHIHDILRAGVI